MKQAGFNLIELSICMTIALIISSSSYYTYQHHQQTINRKNAELYLQDIALNLQEHQDSKNGYNNLSLEQLGFATTKNNYSFTLQANIHTFLITAQPETNDFCGTLSVDQTGQRMSAGPNNECWH